MKVIVFLGSTMLIAAMILLDKHVDGLGVVNEDNQPKVSRPAPISKPAPLKPTLPTDQKSVAETPEMKNAKIMARLRSLGEQHKSLSEGLREGGVSGLMASIMERDKAEWLLYLNRLGYSAEDSEQVFQMFTNLIVMQGSMSEPEKVDRVRTDFFTKVGAENYHKIKHHFSTQVDRKLINEYQTELGNRSKPLTETQQATIVEAMFQSADGKPSPLQSRTDSMSDKMAYIDRVKDRLKTVLDPHEIDSLGKHLTKIAEKSSKPLPSLPQLPTGSR